MRTFGTLLKNELKLNIRNMNMVIFAIILPLVILVVLGFLYGAKPAGDSRRTPFWISLFLRSAPSPFVQGD